MLQARQVILHNSFAAWYLRRIQTAPGVWTSYQHVWLVASFSGHCESEWVRWGAERSGTRDTVSFAVL